VRDLNPTTDHDCAAAAARLQWVQPRITRLVAGEAEFQTRVNLDAEGTS
jgi:hypothetical protein